MKILNKAGPTHLGGGCFMNAPHVNSAGYPCLGNANDTFERLFRERQFASAVQYALVFLQSVNTADTWGPTSTSSLSLQFRTEKTRRER